MKDHRYLHSKEKFLDYSYLALKNNFESKEEFISFFDSIKPDDEKNLFLKTASFYLFIVKQGDWIVNIPNYDPKIDYLNDTFKYIAIFSLIESLYSMEEHLDYYQYLMRNKKEIKFGIDKKPSSILTEKYSEYKKVYGAQKMALLFFESLEVEDKELIKNKLRLKDQESAFNQLVQILYQMRSNFVHKAELIVGFGTHTTISKLGDGIFINELTINDFQNIFERGLIKRFRN